MTGRHTARGWALTSVVGLDSIIFLGLVPMALVLAVRVPTVAALLLAVAGGSYRLPTKRGTGDLRRRLTGEDAAARLGVSRHRLAFLWAAGDIEKVDREHSDSVSIQRYAR